MEVKSIQAGAYSSMGMVLQNELESYVIRIITLLCRIPVDSM